MNLLSRNAVPLGAILVSGLGSYLLLPLLPPRIPVGWGFTGQVASTAASRLAVLLYPAGMLFVFAFFSALPYIDKSRTRQLKESGVFVPLRNSAVLLFFLMHTMAIGIGAGFVSQRANVLSGAASLAVLLLGDAAASDPKGGIGRWMGRLAGGSEGPALRLARGLIVAGLLGLAGTLSGRSQGVALLLPAAAAWAFSRFGRKAR